MASDYGRHFGFRRSDESYRVAEGRFRTPVTGSALLIGTCVEIDPASPGYVRVAAANAPARTGICGILLQEEDFLSSIYEVVGGDSSTRGIARKGRLSVITNGPGTKVWFQNIAVDNRVDGRSTAAISIVDFTGGIAVGDSLGWNGTKWAKTVTAAAAHLEVTEVDTGKAYLEAVCLK